MFKLKQEVIPQTHLQVVFVFMHLLMLHNDEARQAFLGSKCHSQGASTENAPASVDTTSLCMADDET